MVKVKLNEAGIRELLNSPEIQGELLDKASEVSRRAGGRYRVDVAAGKRRAHARVEAVTEEAVLRERSDNPLIRALGSM